MISSFHCRRIAGIAVVAFVVAIQPSGAQEQQPRPPQPAARPTAAFKLPKVETRTLSNGLRIAIIQNHTLPVVAVRVAIAGDSLFDPPGKEGLSSVTRAMLREGTTSLTGDRLADAIADLGAAIRAESFTTTRPFFDRSLALMAGMLTQPVFPQASLDRVKATTSAQVQREQTLAGSVGRRVLFARLYGANHPVARAMALSPKTIASITRDDVVQFHDQYIRPENVTIVIAGDVTPADAEASVARAFGSWQRGAAPVVYRATADSVVSRPTTIYLVDRPGVPQSSITVGQLGPARGVADAAALDAVTAVVGVGGASRLLEAISTRHGYAYGITQALTWRRGTDASSFNGTSGVLAAVTDTALAVWLRELTAVRGERPVTSSELDDARNHFVTLPVALVQTVSQVADKVAAMIRDGMSFDYYDRLAAALASVTPASATAAAAKYIDPSQLTIVIVGDALRVEAGLRALAVGPVIRVDEAGVPKP